MRKKIILKIKKEIKKIKDKKLRKLTKDLFENPKITFTNVKAKISFFESPAAPRAHHSYEFGLIDHIYGVLKISLGLSKTYKELYNIEVNKDLIISASVLHDIFKYYQYEKDAITGGFKIRDDWFLSHSFTIIAELSKRKASDKLIRLISEVHGTVPFTMMESQILNLADSIDAKFASRMQDILWKICRDIEIVINIHCVKCYYIILRKFSIFEIAKLYYKYGREALLNKLLKFLEKEA